MPEEIPVAPASFPSMSHPLTRHLVNVGVSLLLSILVAWLATKGIVIQPPVVEDAPTPKTQSSNESNPSFGWLNDPDAVAESHGRTAPLLFGKTPAGQVALGDTIPDTFLWQAVRQAANRSDPWYPNVDQREVGCCVGCGWKHAADVCQAVQVVTHGGEFKPVSAEVIYGLSRVEVGRGRIRGDGSIGAWAREAVRDFGVAPMQYYPSADLTRFDPQRARRFGESGVPREIEMAAKEHPVKATALVTSWSEVQRSIAQGYPVAVCSNQGFADPDSSPGHRDSEGFCKPRGTWPHCLAIIGIRGGSRPGAFLLNSWGDAAHLGPTWPADAPKAGFWADARIIDAMVAQGDSYSLADLAGFPKRELDWFTQRPQRPTQDFATIHPIRRLK